MEKKNYETETTDTPLLDELIENQKQQTLVDIALSNEAGKEIAGMYDPVGIYNIPRKSESGKLDWGGLCDIINCPYKNQDKHIHTLGVGIAGAKRAMSLYGNLEIMPEEPHLIDGEGEKLWSCTATGIDHHNKNQIKLTYMQSASIKTREGKVFKNDNMPMIVQSKAIRNVILFLVPGSIQQKWIDNYIAGKQPFDNGKQEDTKNETLTLESIIKIINQFSSIESIETYFKRNRKVFEAYPEYEKIVEKCKSQKWDIIFLALMGLGEFQAKDIRQWLDIESNAKIAEEAALGNEDAINKFKADMQKPKETESNEEGKDDIPF